MYSKQGVIQYQYEYMGQLLCHDDLVLFYLYRVFTNTMKYMENEAKM